MNRLERFSKSFPDSLVGRASRPSSACKADQFFTCGELTGETPVPLKKREIVANRSAYNVDGFEEAVDTYKKQAVHLAGTACDYFDQR